VSDSNQKTESGQQQLSYVGFAGISTSFSSPYLKNGACNFTSSVGTWILDTGASDHTTCDLALFENVYNLSTPFIIDLPNGEKVTISKAGNVRLCNNIMLQHVLFVPAFKLNLLSISMLC